MLIMLPWSKVWGLLLIQFPPTAAQLLDSPLVRGVLSGFGVLHLLLVIWELINPTLLASVTKVQTESQEGHRS